MKAVSDAAAVARELSGRLKKIKLSRQSVKDPRIHITNPSLCHDAVKRLAPSLKAHHGCDLIDIRPGPCLWSKHLHETLQPRRHILIEPEREKFDQFIAPLIQEYPDRYCHAESLTQALDPSSGLLSAAISHRSNDNSLTTKTSALLITANLSGYLQKGREYRGLGASYFLSDYCQSFTPEVRSNIHRYGLVRMLAWIPDTFKHNVMPRTVAERTRQSIFFEACASVSEIASSGWRRAANPSKRENLWPALWTMAAKEVQRAEAVAALETPEYRRATPPWSAPWTIPPHPDMMRDQPGLLEVPGVQNLLRLDAKLKTEAPEWRQNIIHLASTSEHLPLSNNLDHRSFRDALQKWRYHYHQFQKVSGIVVSQLELEQQWHDKFCSEGGIIDPETKSRLLSQSQAHSHAINKLRKLYRLLPRISIDDYRAYNASPKALAWNRRQFEPLMVHSDDFYPENPMALMDFQPLPRFRQLLSKDHQPLLFDQMLGALSRNTLNADVHRSLTELLAGGVDEFVETVPSLKDPTKGGYLDMTDLRLRSLPVETFFDLVLAYDEWPFRPERELMFEDGKGTEFNAAANF